MSQVEVELLRELQITQTDLASALSVTPQRVSQGLRERGSYLTPARVQALYLHLTNHDATKAEKFRQEALKVLPGKVREILQLRAAAVTSDPITEPPITKKGTARPWVDSQEIWVFSNRPKEIEQPDYLERMERDFFRRRNPPDRPVKRIVYFAPPDISDRLCRYLASSFRLIDPNERTEVIVIETPAVAICPKFLIFDAMSTEPTGWVACEGQDTYARLSRKQVDSILDNLRASGVGGRKDQILVPPEERVAPESNCNPYFAMRFSSREVRYDQT